jgi:hypothetical protein
VGHTFNWCSLLPATLVADKGVGVTVLHQSALSLAAAIRRRETSSVELVTEATELRDRFDGALNAITWKDDGASLAHAREAAGVGQTARFNGHKIEQSSEIKLPKNARQSGAGLCNVPGKGAA